MIINRLEEKILVARIITLPAVALTIALLVAGCGGGDSSSAGEDRGSSGTIATSSLSKEEFLKRAEAACTRRREKLVEEIGAYLQSHQSSNPPVLYADMTRAVWLPTIEAELKAIEAIGAPEGDEEEIEELIAAKRAAIKDVAALHAVPSTEAVESHFVSADKLARAYGFLACTNSPEPR